jgi:acyl dehydratase
MRNAEREASRITPPITRTQIVRFAGAAGDFNPMHHDAEFATTAGLPGVFAMGQLPAAMLASFVAGWLGRDRVRDYGVRFRDKVWPGDRLVLRGEIVEEGAGELRCELEVRRESDDAVVITGWARAVGQLTSAGAGTSSSSSAIRSA